MKRRKLNLLISAGVVAVAAMSLLTPHLAVHATVLGTIVNLIWIWE